jgi:serine/threonine protein kinase
MVPPHHHLHLASHHHNQPPFPRPRKLDHWKVNNEPFELDSRYTVLEYLGSGAYGVVCSAVDTIAISSYVYPLATTATSAPCSAPASAAAQYQYRQTASSSSSSLTCCTPSTNAATPSPPPPPPEIRRDYIAIKKCKNIFESRTMAKRTLREIRLVRCLSHPHVRPPSRPIVLITPLLPLPSGHLLALRRALDLAPAVLLCVHRLRTHGDRPPLGHQVATEVDHRAYPGPVSPPLLLTAPPP